MPSSKSTNKIARSMEGKRLRNRLVRSSVGTHISKARSLISEGKVEPAQQGVVVATRSIDKATSKRVIHKNRSARLKSQLARKLNAMGAVPQVPDSGEAEAEVEQS